MKNFKSLFLLLIIVSCQASKSEPLPNKSNFQKDNHYAKQEADSVEFDIDLQVTNLKTELSERISNQDKIDFMLDTFRLNQSINQKMSDYSNTLGSVTLLQEEIGSYDKLLNKYYQRLLKKINPSDRDILIEAQRSWLAYRDDEIKLLQLIREDEYSGGGTIQPIIFLDRKKELTKNRVFQLVEYLFSLY
jgi:uncharacterized protein YecT (DUF1311 family)